MARAVRSWTTVVPLAAVAALALLWGRDLAGIGIVAALALLGGAVIAAVHHAEVIADRVGEPYGSLVLAVAVTVIEVSLIVVLMVSSDSGKPTLARDTVFSAVMITCNGIVGLAILTATWKGGEARFNSAGTGAGLASIVALAGLSLVLPTFTTSTPGPTFSAAQLTFAAIASLALYLLYVFVQAVRHRDYFLAPNDPDPSDSASSGHHANVWASSALLVASLVAVVGLGKVVSPSIEQAVADAGLPISVVAVAIALIVLLPESLAAWRAARRGAVQTSFNLAYGSAMASIGLTIPAVALASWILDTQLHLGLGPVELVLLSLTAIVSVLTVTPGKATLLQGGVHLAVFAGFLVLAFSP